MSGYSSYDEKQLFQRIADGDERAFRVVVHHYYPILMAFILKITKSTVVAEEVVQEVFLKLWLKRDSIDIQNLGGWLHTVASNQAFNYLRKVALDNKLVATLGRITPDHCHTIEEAIDYKESEALLKKALDQLPPQQRMVYHLSKVDGLSREEIAEQLDLSPNTVKNHLLRATQFIREFMRKGVGLFWSTGIWVFQKYFE